MSDSENRQILVVHILANVPLHRMILELKFRRDLKRETNFYQD